MDGCLCEVSKCIDIYSWVIDESTDYLNGGVHGSVVNRRPLALVSIVDIYGQLRGLLLKELDKCKWLILDDALQEILMQFVQLLPVIIPNRLQHSALISSLLP